MTSKELTEKLNEKAIEYKKETNEEKKKALKEEVDALTYDYVKIVTRNYIKSKSPLGITQDKIDDISSEIYLNRIINPELEVLDKYDEEKAKYSTYISRKVSTNVYHEARKLSVVKISDTQKRYLILIKKYFEEAGIDTSNANECSPHKEEALEYLNKHNYTGNVLRSTFDALWIYYFQKNSDVEVTHTNLEKDESAVELEDKGSNSEDYEKVDILANLTAMLDEAIGRNILTKLEAESFKLEVCDIYAIEIEDKYNIKNKYNSSFTLEETGYKLFFSGLLDRYFPKIAKTVEEKHTRKIQDYKKTLRA